MIKTMSNSPSIFSSMSDRLLNIDIYNGRLFSLILPLYG